MHVGITTLGTDAGKSGISQYLFNLLEAFRRRNTDCTFELIALEREAGLFTSDSADCTVLSISNRFASPVASIAWHQLVLPGVCRKRGYDVLFLPAANRRSPWRLPCPSVGTVHDFSSLHVEGKYDAAREFYIRKILPFLARQLDEVITVSVSSKRDIVDYARVKPDSVHVTPLGVDRVRFHVRDREIARRAVAGLVGDKPYFVYVARLEHPGKNHVRLIEAFERLKLMTGIPHRLVLPGAPRERATEIYAAAQGSAVARDIEFTGFVDDDTLPELYAAAEATIFPSLYEGFGLPVLEAMACGTPVACSNTSSLPEVVGDAALLFDPKDVDSIADRMLQIVFEPGLRTRLADAGPKRARHFDWAATAGQTLDVLQMAAEARSASMAGASR